MPRRVSRCRCGHRACNDWHVSPEAALQGVKFTYLQAVAVAAVLDTLDKLISNPAFPLPSNGSTLTLQVTMPFEKEPERADAA